ncbi:MAG TPA: N-acetylglucosamine-6-phosphate deacetylase [Vicinamibacterales bacterium]|nr:N-acetylglucosamine-6-phosphate deacetylase [Vicinamibacterales bacterium]
MIFLSGADVVLPDRVLGPATIAIDEGRIVEIASGVRPRGARDEVVDIHQHVVVPGFIDVHVHGVEGSDTLDGGEAIRRIASRLPRFGVTAFCPTSIACHPGALRRMLGAVREARLRPERGASRVLPAHLESNFINPAFNGAQPLECLRLPVSSQPTDKESGEAEDFSGADILREIDSASADIGIVTLAPELDGGIDLVRHLVAAGHHVSLGHSGATYEEAQAGIAAGARQATHLFNRMSPLGHRAPGLTGAVLEREDVTVELVSDGVHVHPAVMRVALAAKTPARVMAITDGTAGSGLPRGARTTIGGRPITVGDVARLDDGTIAGSVLTMDRAFGVLVAACGLGLVEAAAICSTTPARQLGLQGLGTISPGSTADLVVLDARLRVAQTWIGGTRVWPLS